MPTNVPKISSNFTIELLLKNDSTMEKEAKLKKQCVTKPMNAPIDLPLNSPVSVDLSRDVSPVNQMADSDSPGRFMNCAPHHRILNNGMQQSYQQQLPFTPPDNLLSLNAMQQQHQQILNTQLQMAAALNYQYNASMQQPQAMNFSQIFSNNFHRTSYHMQRFPYGYSSGKHLYQLRIIFKRKIIHTKKKCIIKYAQRAEE